MVPTDDEADQIAEARREAWLRADLTYLLHDGQLELYEHFFAAVRRRLVWHCARRFGKSYLLCIIAITFCLRRAKSIVVYAAPSREQIKQFIWPIMDQLIADAPPQCAPVYVASEHSYRFPNGSIIHLDGADDDQGDHLRGPKADLVIGDECGFWRYLAYVIKSVLAARTLGIKHAKTILASSSPESTAHEFVGFIAEAKARGTYCKKVIYDNPRLTQADIDEFADDLGGHDSTAFRREALCELVTDESRAVVPEFDADRHVVAAFERPQYFDAYDGMDLGLVDFTHVLFGFYDFTRAKLVIEGEVVTNYCTTPQLAIMVRSKEIELWGPDKQPTARYSDNELQQLHDLAAVHKLPFIPALKHDRDEAINRLREMFRLGKIEIHERCVSLIHQLQVAIWNKQRTDLERLPGAGHVDGVMALVYLARMVDYNKNPAPVVRLDRKPGFGQIATPIVHAYSKKPTHQLAKILPTGRRH